MVNYPAQIDTSQSLPTVVDNLTPVQGLIFNRLRSAVLALESELGVKPSSVYGTVRHRLDVLEQILNSGGGGGGDGVQLNGDLGNTKTFPFVVGIHGRPIANTAPSVGQTYLWNGASWSPGDTITLTSDLGNTITSPNVVGLRGRPILSTAPGVNQAYLWNGSAWEPGDVQMASLTVTLSGGSTVEVSQTITNPAFTATYSLTPTIAIFSDSDGGSQSVSTTSPANFNSNYNFTKNTFGAAVTFTISATRGSTETASVQSHWGQRSYWGVGTAGQTGQAFVLALGNSQITLSRAITFSATAGGAQKIYFSCRSAYGTPTFTVGGFSGGFAYTSTFSITNAFGFSENYDLYESDNVGLGSTTVVVT